MVRISRIVVLALVCCMAPSVGAAGTADEETRQGSQATENQEQGNQENWYTDYSEAVRAAEVYGKMLFIVFHDPARPSVLQAFEKSTLANAGVQRRLDRYVLAKLPVTATTTINGQDVVLLQHASFSEMQRREGVAIIDYANSGTAHYGRVVSTFPFLPGHYYTPERMNVILDLPRGSLMQRTMIYAVRIHPERPQSTTGDFHPVLADEASSHSGVINSVLKQVGLMDERTFFAWSENPTTSLGAVIAVDVWKTTPFMALLLLAGMQVIPSDVYEASHVDGASKIQQFFHMTLPLLKPALLVAPIFRTLDAFRVFDMIYVLNQYNPDTMSIAVYTQQMLIGAQRIGEGSAPAVIIFLCIGFLAFIYTRLIRVEDA